ncbi:MAG TPA: glycosyl hydrolase, partial [Acidobacteriota bacterium]|nr:glycosyl hydrolase [Acidobacteriota bacterium]
LIVVGTDDGLIQITEDGGGEWRQLKSEDLLGIDQPVYVADVVTSRHDADRMWAVFNNHKNNDFKPYLLRSDDRGQSWTKMVEGVPEENSPLWTLVEDHVDSDLLFLGGEYGLFFSIDGGTKWIAHKSGLPTIAVRDLAVQERENDLALATFGRSFYILDDYAPLREVSEPLLEEEGHIFPVRDALMFVEDRRRAGSSGDAFFSADNPPYGAIITYYIKDAVKTKRAMRKEASTKEEPIEPTREQLREEEREIAPAVYLTVRDAQGNVVRRLEGANRKGVHRIAWDLRDPGISLETSGGGRGRRGGGGSGPLVMPGDYTVTLSRLAEGQWTDLAGPVSFRVRVEGEVTLPAGDRQELVDFQRQTYELMRAVSSALRVANASQERLEQIRAAILQTPRADTQWLAEQAVLKERLQDILLELRGDPDIGDVGLPSPPSINNRVSSVAFGSRFSTSAPTQTQRDQYGIAAQAFGEVLPQLRQLVEVDLPALEEKLTQAGAPYTPGRLPEWNPGP